MQKGRDWSNDVSGQLPKTTRDLSQPSLFRHSWHNIRREHGIERHQAEVLYKCDLLSFNPSTVVEVGEAQLDELIFTKRLIFDSGLPREIALAMLSQLEKPYQYSYEQIYWDFGTGKWQSVEAKARIHRWRAELLSEQEFDEQLERTDPDLIDRLEQKLRDRRIRRVQEETAYITKWFSVDAARACFDELDAAGFAATINLLSTLSHSPKLIDEQREQIQRGIQLLGMFPKHWPRESFYLRAANGEEAWVEISLGDDNLSIEMWSGTNYIFEFHFDREQCSGSADGLVGYIEYVNNEVFETTYEEFEISWGS